MHKVRVGYYFKWLARCEEWKTMLERGADAPKRTDGQMLNGVRNQMLFLLGQIEEDGLTLEEVLTVAQEYGMQLEPYQKKLPPVMDEMYMKDADLIRVKGRAAYKVFAVSEDLAYLKETMEALKYDRGGATYRDIQKKIGFVDELGDALEKDRLLTVRAYMDVEEGLDRLRWSRVLTEARIKHLSPFEEK